jgi:leucyl aminopeptidase
VATPSGEVADLIAASLRVRDWVNTPTEDMGPQQLEDAARALADAHGAQVEAITGDELLKQNFPAIHAVGRASHRAPRLVVLRWGRKPTRHWCWSARACASIPAAWTSSRPTACAT